MPLLQRFTLFTILKILSQQLIKALSCYFKRGWIGAPLSIWNNVTKVLPGNIVKIQQNKNGNYYIKNQSYYWNCKQVSIKKPKYYFNGGFELGVKKLEELLFEVLEGQSLSDVPLGVFYLVELILL